MTNVKFPVLFSSGKYIVTKEPGPHVSYTPDGFSVYYLTVSGALRFLKQFVKEENAIYFASAMDAMRPVVEEWE